MRQRPFAMERWQSTYENRVDHNLSESGVHPLTLGELLELAAGTGAVGSEHDGGEADAVADLLETSLGYGQSNGTDALRAAIARLYDGANDTNVVVTNGSAEANFVALWRLVRPGDEVVILVPTYMQTHGLADGFGARVREVPLREEAGWQPDPDAIADAVRDATRIIVVTNPNNPTGAVLGDEARDAVLRAAERSGAWILADEVYAGAELDGPPTPSFWGASPRVIATGSLSKAYGLPGLRIGWAVAPAALADELWARTDYTTISPGTLTDRLAALALATGTRPRLLERTRRILRTGLDRLDAWLRPLDAFTYRPPDAGAIAYVRYDLPVASPDFAERLRAEQSVLIVPGAHFGMGPYLRFGYGLLDDDLRAALERVGRLVRDLRGAPAGDG
ncbi:MAG: aminotransferase class I/II-fold pyridoxal phosphate-dependent enzyme [Gemmatimonadota bacterium]